MRISKEQLAPIYTIGIPVVGAVVLVAGSAATDANRFDLLMFLFLAGLAGVSQRLPVFLFRNSAISVAFSATIATYALFGMGPALWVNLVSATVNAFTPKRKPLEKALFNAGVLTISAAIASTAYLLLGGQTPPRDVLPVVVAVAISGLLYFLVNSALVTGVITLTTRNTFTAVYKENYAWMVVNWVATSVNGAALALAYQALAFFGAMTFVMPLVVAWYSFKLYMVKSQEVRRRNEELRSLNAVLEQTNLKLHESHLSIISALVGALEAKDRYTHGHAAATMFHAVGLARKFELTEEEVATVQLAALFHDIGKIGVAEHILRKPGPLGYNEWGEIKNHTQIGANLLANIPTLSKVRPIVLAHHERWDGTGYPTGLKGEDIPFEARIVAVCDAFQAMISMRPYRSARTRAEALEELRRCAGTQFDPQVVAAFVELIEEETAAAVTPEQSERAKAHVFDRAIEAARIVHREGPTS